MTLDKGPCMLHAKLGGVMAIEPLHLSGLPEARGRQQAALAPDAVGSVRASVESRLAGSRELLGRPGIQDYLAKQWEFLGQHAPAQAAEIEGIAEGYGLSPRDLSAYLHLGILDHRPVPVDGCSTFAAVNADFGTFVAKNRDYGGDHRELQKVFVHSDPESTGKKCLFVGSLGSPGAFSSGMNSEGLALADTRVDWPDPGVGWLRYCLMTEVLWRADTVEEAIEFISSVPHAGGGSLAMVDASGTIVSIEFGHPEAVIQSSRAGAFFHTNHYVFEPFADTAGQDPVGSAESNSRARLQVLRQAAERYSGRTSLQEIVDLFSSHDAAGGSLCRHEEDGEPGTISTAIFCCETRRLLFFGGNPCESPAHWISF